MINDKQEWYSRPIMRTPTEPSNHTGIYQAERRGIKDFCIARVYDKQDVSLIARAPLLIECREVLRNLFEECAMIHRYGGEIDNTKKANAAEEAARALLAKLEE